MRSGRSLSFALAGVVVGVVIAVLVAVVVWPSGSSSGRSVSDEESSKAVGDLEDVAAPEPPALPGDVELTDLDLSPGNRRAPIEGLPDWSRAGYRDGRGLPAEDDLTDDEACRISADELSADYGVAPDDGNDDSTGLQEAIDTIRDECSPEASYEELSLLELPAGVIDVSRQISVDADYLVIRGAGPDPAQGTRLVFRPDENTRYDALTEDGGDWDEDGMDYGDGSGGWIWPGRGLFRVQSRDVHEDYLEDYESAPDNRRDIFEGTVNVHWKSGQTLREKPGEDGFSARAGDTVVHLAEDADMDLFAEGGFVNIRAANSIEFYEQQQALPTDHELQNLHMRQQIFTIAEVDADNQTLTVDKPLEFDLPVDSVSDGSEEIEGDVYESKAAPLVDPVVGVGFEGIHISQVASDLDPADAVHDYANLAPADQMHGIVFKWAVDSWVRDSATYMTGSHPIVTEEAKNLQIEGNYFDGSWNKGEGGNGYLRGSRVWDSLYAGNVVRNLRHFTFQWSASGNVFIGNDLDADVNLHGGWERHNLVELNTVHVAYEHRPGNCSTNCGGEGGDEEDASSWYPIWWAAGQKAVKWSGASGPQNVFFNNTMTVQPSDGGDEVPYYDDATRIYQFGWDGSAYQHLVGPDGEPITDWAGNEEADYTDRGGVFAERTDDNPSLFLTRV